VSLERRGRRKEFMKVEEKKRRKKERNGIYFLYRKELQEFKTALGISVEMNFLSRMSCKSKEREKE
jgi:hypothetical protein